MPTNTGVVESQSYVDVASALYPVLPRFVDNSVIPFDNVKMAWVFTGSDASIMDLTKNHTMTKVGAPFFIENQWGLVCDNTNYIQTNMPETDNFSVITIARQAQDATLNDRGAVFSNLISVTDGEAAGFDLSIHGNGATELRTWTTIASVFASTGLEIDTFVYTDVTDRATDSARYRTDIVTVSGDTEEMYIYDTNGYNPVNDLPLDPASRTTPYTDRRLSDRLKGGNFRIGGTPLPSANPVHNIQVLGGIVYDIALTPAQLKEQFLLLKADIAAATTGVSGYPIVNL